MSRNARFANAYIPILDPQNNFENMGEYGIGRLKHTLIGILESLSTPAKDPLSASSD